MQPKLKPSPVAGYIDDLAEMREIPEFTFRRIERDARAALQANPRDADALTVLAILASYTDNKADELEYCRKAFEIQPTAAGGLNLVLALGPARWVEAREVLRQVLTMHPEAPETMPLFFNYVLSSIASGAGDTALVAELLEESVPHAAPNSVRDQFLLLEMALIARDAGSALHLAGRILVLQGAAEWNVDGFTSLLAVPLDVMAAHLGHQMTFELARYMGAFTEPPSVDPGTEADPGPEYYRLVEEVMEWMRPLRAEANRVVLEGLDE